MKKSIVFTAIFALCFTLSADIFAADTEVAVYADESYPPYSYKEDGEIRGIYTEILRKAFSRMEGYTVRIKAVPWKNGLKKLEKGDGFALYPPYYLNRERPYIWPYSLPILEEKVVLFCTQDVLASPRPEWPEDYYGLTIGNNAGFQFGGDKFWKAVKEGKIKVDEVKGNEKNLLKLGLRRVDCYMNDRLSVLWELKRLKAAGKYDEGGKHAKISEGVTISIEQGFLGFTDRDNGKFSYKDDFVKKFNRVIYEMRKTGELQKMVREKFGGPQ